VAHCFTCNAEWTAGRYSEACEECGGGAMTRPCTICGGRCGVVMRRAVSDSNDSGLGHWAGRCNLPPDEQRALLKAKSAKTPFVP
jgi:hypothetical protein